MSMKLYLIGFSRMTGSPGFIVSCLIDKLILKRIRFARCENVQLVVEQAFKTAQVTGMPNAGVH